MTRDNKNEERGEQGLDEREVVAADKKKYPNCYHQTQSSTHCASNEEGKMVCETIRQVSRICPGARTPSVIFQDKRTGGEHTSMLGRFFFGDRSSDKISRSSARESSGSRGSRGSLDDLDDLDDLSESLLDAYQNPFELRRDGRGAKNQRKQLQNRSRIHELPPQKLPMKLVPPSPSSILEDDEFDRQLSRALAGVGEEGPDQKA